MGKLLFILFFGTLFGMCKNHNKPTQKNQTDDSLFAERGEKRDIEIDTTDFTHLEREDSSWRQSYINKIHKLAEKHFSDAAFNKEDTFYKISIGNILSNKHRHALIKVEDRGRDVFFNIYKLAGAETISIMFDTVGNLNYVADSIADINGDGTKEFYHVVYSSAGCCRRNNYTIWTLNQVTGKLNDPVRLMNPTFYPKEKVIRGVEYGHSGEVPLYKAKWDGNKIIPIQYIYPLPGKPGFFLKKKAPDYKDKAPGDTIRGLPEEYKTVKDLDWFLLFTEEKN